MGGQKPRRDSLSDQQRWWLRWFAQAGVRAGVIHLAGKRIAQTQIAETRAAARTPRRPNSPSGSVATLAGSARVEPGSSRSRRKPARRRSASAGPAAGSLIPTALFHQRVGQVSCGDSAGAQSVHASDAPIVWASNPLLTVPAWLALADGPNPGRLIRFR